MEQRIYSPFGASAAAITGPVTAGFTGHEHDSAQGLINMRGRMYDPAIGRFLTPDPVLSFASTQGLNPYSYVRNSPLNLVDPSGWHDSGNSAGQGQPACTPENGHCANEMLVTATRITRGIYCRKVLCRGRFSALR